MKKLAFTLSKLFAIGLLLLVFCIAIYLVWNYCTDIIPCLQSQANQKILFDPKNSSAHLDLFLPKKQKGSGAIIIFPGGGYQILVCQDGAPVAKWLADQGIVTFVLYYRLPRNGNYVPTLEDAVRSVSYVRMHAKDWHVNGDKIAIMGFSAGAHLASVLATHAQYNDEKMRSTDFSASSRPDFEILISPLLTMEAQSTHKLSRKNFLGDNPNSSLVEFFSSVKQINSSVPPTFIYHSRTDKTVPVINSDEYALKLQKARIPVDYIQGSDPSAWDGGHGKGLNNHWTKSLIHWLAQNHFIENPDQ